MTLVTITGEAGPDIDECHPIDEERIRFFLQFFSWNLANRFWRECQHVEAEGYTKKNGPAVGSMVVAEPQRSDPSLPGMEVPQERASTGVYKYLTNARLLSGSPLLSSDATRNHQHRHGL